MMKFPARIALTILILILGILSLPLFPAHSQKAFATENYSTYQPPNPERERVFAILGGLMSFTSCQLSGIDVVERTQLCPGQRENEQLGGALGFVTATVPILYTSPASSVEYVDYLAHNFGLSKTAYAQEESEGFTALSPVIALWKVVRDFTYLMAIIIFIIIGFGIMIRFKIDPRTVMTIQNQVPKIIVGLVMITFSYSIAGLMVDAMWLTTYAGLNTLGGTIEGGDSVAGEATKGILNNPINYASDVLNYGTADPSTSGPFDGIRDLSGNVGKYVGGNMADVVVGILGLGGESSCDPGVSFSIKKFFKDVVSLNPLDRLKPGLSVQGFGGCVTTALSTILYIIFTPIITIIIFIAVLIALFRVWFMLLKSYIYVLLYTIFGPLFILLGLLPESQFGFTRWIRAFVARLLVFPAAALVFMVARMFIDKSVVIQSGLTKQQDFVPPLVGNPNIVDSGLGPIIAFGLIMITPELLNMLMEAFKTQPFKYTPAITSGFAKGAAIGGALARMPLSRLTRFDHQKQEAGAIGAFTHERVPKIIKRVPGFSRFRSANERYRESQRREKAEAEKIT